MKLPRLTNNIKVHPGVWRKIKEIEILDKGKAGRIIQRITELALDPIPITSGCTSETVLNLRKKGISVKRLKCVDILDYRIFYAYKKSGMICVYCVVLRNEDTYKEDSHHYMLIKLLYTQWRECQ